MAEIPSRNKIRKGNRVLVETKENQGTGKLTEGLVEEILTSSESHPHGIKVKLQDGQVGRVKSMESIIDKTITEQTQIRFVDLNEIKIPKIEDRNNEFKEFYQYDQNIDSQDNSPEGKKAVNCIKNTVQERLATAVCSFGNAYQGGFIYIGIKTDGAISGLEKDKKLGNFDDYGDSFANHIIDTLLTYLKDKVFITSKLQIRFRNIEDKTICIIQILPADRPIYLNAGNKKSFFVRGPVPRAIKFDMDEHAKYVRRRFPHHR